MQQELNKEEKDFIHSIIAYHAKVLKSNMEIKGIPGSYIEEWKLEYELLKSIHDKLELDK